MGVAEFTLPFDRGLTDAALTNSAGMNDGSYNFYIDSDGYLTNYPGKSDIFQRPEDPPSYLSSPPPTNVQITRVHSFIDVQGETHLVFVQGNKLYEKDGNGFTELYTFVGVDYNGEYYPHMFTHEGRLIILNMGDPPMLWDGYEGVHPLGVRESPIAPDLRAHPAPGMNQSLGGGPAWEYADVCWIQDTPTSYPSHQVHTNEDGSTDEIDGVYQVVIQFVDKYGNKGRVSSPSQIVTVRHAVEDPGGGGWEFPDYLISEWYPPLVDPHIHSVIIGRTLNMNPEDDEGGPSTINVFYFEYKFVGTTLSRFVHQIGDPQLASNGAMDVTVHAPEQAAGGCSWGGRVFLWGHVDANTVTWSDVDLFGQFRSTNKYRAKGKVVTCVPMGDRIAVVMENGLDILYEVSGVIALLEQINDHGAKHGRSFVDVGGIAFGLWNDGFGYYDGSKFERVGAPFFVEGDYIDWNHNVLSAKLHGDTLLLTVRKDHVTDRNNYLLMYSLSRKEWFLLSESVNDIVFYDDMWIGCSDSLYELFVGDYPDISKIVIKGFLPKEASSHNTRSLNGLRLMLEPSSNLTFEVRVKGNVLTSTDTSSTLLPSDHKVSRFTNKVPYWNEAGKTYAQEPEWSAPGDRWVPIEMKNHVTGNAHDIKLTFPVGHRIRLRGLAISMTMEHYGD